MTIVDIWNKALALLPHDTRVESVDDDSTEALRCRDHWDDARRSVLASYNWGWATESYNAQGCESPHYTKQYAYIRPNALKFIGVFNHEGRRTKCDIINNRILTTEPIVEVRVIEDRQDIDDWPLWFADAVIAELASRIALPITGNKKTSDAMFQLANMRLANAKMIDSSEVAWHGTDGKTFIKARR